MMMARLSLLHSLPRLASVAPFLCLIVAQCEWPDMVPPAAESCVYTRFILRLAHAGRKSRHRSRLARRVSEGLAGASGYPTVDLARARLVFRHLQLALQILIAIVRTPPLTL